MKSENGACQLGGADAQKAGKLQGRRSTWSLSALLLGIEARHDEPRGTRSWADPAERLGQPELDLRKFAHNALRASPRMAHSRLRQLHAGLVSRLHFSATTAFRSR